MLGRSLKRTAMRDAGVLGAALMAGVGGGVFTDLQQAAREFVRYDKVFEPNGIERQRHDDRYGLYQLLYRQLVPFNQGRVLAESFG